MAAVRKTQVQAGEVYVTINPPKNEIARVRICGNTIYVSNAFSEEARQQMAAGQARGEVDRSKKNKKREPKDFEKGFRGSLHQSTEGWYGIPCISFRAAMVRAASLCGVEMTRAKMCVFVEPDGFSSEGTPLVRIVKGEPEKFLSPVRNDNGSPDIRARGRFAPGWECVVTLRYDGEFLSASSVINLLARAGFSVGVGAGRPFSTKSVGQGWGTFDVVGAVNEEKAAAE
jgi:hypothetical protein